MAKFAGGPFPGILHETKIEGAAGLLSEGRVGLVYTEIILGATYENAATFDELYALMRQHGYRLVTFYRISYRDGMATSTDALYARPDKLKQKTR